MRVLISCDRIGRLGSAGASGVVAGAFVGRDAQAAVAPVSERGEGLTEVLARFSPGAQVLTVENPRQARDMLAEGPNYLDVIAVTAPELGESLELLVTPVRAGTTTVVPHRETGRTLAGLTGSLVERGRETGAGIAVALTEDSHTAAWLERLGATDQVPMGALCGLGIWALDCGTRVASGVRVCVGGYRLSELAAKTDVTVTGADVLDLHRRDRDVVTELARLGVGALRPVVTVTGQNFVPPRKLRLAGIEEAHAVAPPGMEEIDITAGQLEALMQRVANTWTW